MTNPPPYNPPTPPPPLQQPAPQKKSIWKNKWFWIIIGAVMVIGVIGNALGLGAQPNAATAPAAPAVAQIEVPDVVGMAGNDAEKLLRDRGFMIERDGGAEAVVATSNWDVTATDPSAGTKADKGSTIKVTFARAADRLAAEQAARDAATAERNAAPIEATEAQAFCDNYATLMFPYGVKMHWVMGKLAEEPREGGGWFLKVEATVTNEYGAKQSGVNVECHVSGTNGAPQMDDFLYY